MSLASLALLSLSLMDPPASAPLDDEIPRPSRHPVVQPDERVRSHGFVVSTSLGVNFFTLAPLASGELSVFLGGALPIIPRRPGHWIALGYQGTVSVGKADIGTTLGNPYWFGHRHHLAFQGVAGLKSRLAYGASLGLAGFALEQPHHDGDSASRGVLAVDIEGRLGYVFGAADPGIAQGMVGVQLRLASQITSPPIYPTLGLFLGCTFGRGLPSPPTRRRTRAR